MANPPSRPKHFGEWDTALRFRALIRKLVMLEVKRNVMPERYGVVTSIDYENSKAQVGLDGGSITVAFPPTCQPTNVGQVVRIGGTPGNRYITALSTNPEWIEPTLRNSWVPYGGAYVTPSYRRHSDGRVFVRGTIKSGTTDTAAFILPVGFRPADTLIFSTRQATAAARVEVDASGNVVPKGITNNTLVSLDGIAFDVL